MRHLTLRGTVRGRGDKQRVWEQSGEVLSTLPSNLPAALTSFIGRENEIGEIIEQLMRTRLLTLTGTGGVGKTRLALAVAERVADHFAGGVWLCELGALADPLLVVQAVAAALGVREAGARPVLEVLIDTIGQRVVLLVIDNCEHLLDGCAELCQALLRACPGLQVMVTSRESLGLRGETVWAVPTLGESEAVRLFVDRAASVQPGYTASAGNASATAEICRRLDGMPLAIELAAAWVKTLSVQEIAARLDDRFLLLTGGRRTALPRQQTLKGTLDWSYALLAEPERIMFRRLAVFDGGWSLDAAEAVCRGDSLARKDALGLIAALVDKSLVLADSSMRPTRYRMLETTRQYGLELLEDCGETELMRGQHAAYFRELARIAQGELLGQEQLQWLERLDQEQDNCRAALRWVIERDEPDAELEIVASLWDYWWMRGHLSEGQRLVEAALTRAGPVRSHMRARATHGAGLLAAVQGDFEQGATRFAESVERFRELGGGPGMVRPLGDLASTMAFVGRTSVAEQLIGEAVEVARNGNDPWAFAYAVHSLAQVNLALKRYDQAVVLTEEEVQRWRAIGDARGLAHALLQLGIALRRQHRAARALDFAREGLLLFSELGETWGLLGSLVTVAACATDLDDSEAAARLVGAADAFSRTIGASAIPDWQLEHEYAREHARSSLGGRFEGVVTAGEGMAIGEAIAFATSAVGRRERDFSKHRADGLTRREREVLTLLAQRFSNREIADALVLSIRTVERHIANIYAKTNISSRREAAEYVQRRS